MVGRRPGVPAPFFGVEKMPVAVSRRCLTSPVPSLAISLTDLAARITLSRAVAGGCWESMAANARKRFCGSSCAVEAGGGICTVVERCGCV